VAGKGGKENSPMTWGKGEERFSGEFPGRKIKKGVVPEESGGRGDSKCIRKGTWRKFGV